MKIARHDATPANSASRRENPPVIMAMPIAVPIWTASPELKRFGLACELAVGWHSASFITPLTLLRAVSQFEPETLPSCRDAGNAFCCWEQAGGQGWPS